MKMRLRLVGCRVLEAIQRYWLLGAVVLLIVALLLLFVLPEWSLRHEQLDVKERVPLANSIRSQPGIRSLVA